MRVLYLDITTFFANRDMLDALEHYTDEKGVGLEIIRYPYVYDEAKARSDPEFEKAFASGIRKHVPDFVFSFNFLPVVSKVCYQEGVIYVSWVYSNPEIFLYSYQIINPCNIVLMFDSKEYEIFKKGGINTVEYLPLAASTRRLDLLVSDNSLTEKCSADISFVGSLYTERIQYYDKIAPKLDPYTLGYLDGLIRAQLRVYGYNFVEECLTPEVVENIQKASNIYPHPDSAETPEYLYANYIINRKITIIERQELLTLIGSRYPVKLFTYNKNSSFAPPGVENMGPADYFLEMPYVFKLSKINLNITLRSIQNAIPLRAYDIMGAGGFLLSNYQTDLVRHFVPGEDFVYFEDRNDLMEKIEYYLSHDEERMEIARNAHGKIQREHTFDIRVGQIIELVRTKNSSP